MIRKETNITNRAQNYYDGLVKIATLKTKNIITDEKNYKDWVIYFVRYVLKKSIEMMTMYYRELVEKIEEYDEKSILQLLRLH